MDEITKNIVNEKDSIIKLYTVHSYKGMEEHTIRLAHDIDIIEYKKYIMWKLQEG